MERKEGQKKRISVKHVKKANPSRGLSIISEAYGGGGSWGDMLRSLAIVRKNRELFTQPSQANSDCQTPPTYCTHTHSNTYILHTHKHTLVLILLTQANLLQTRKA